MDATKYHAAISFSNSQFTVVANFGRKNFKFGIEDMLSNHYKEIFDEISSEQIDSKQVFDLVHDYLIHSGFVGTLQAFEDESSFALIKKENEIEEEKDDFSKLANKSGFFMPRKNTLGPDMLLPLSSRDRASANFGTAMAEGSQTERVQRIEELKEELIKEQQDKTKNEEIKIHTQPQQKEADSTNGKQNESRQQTSSEVEKPQDMDTSGEFQDIWKHSEPLNSSLEVSLNTTYVYSINDFSTEIRADTTDNNQLTTKEEIKEGDKEEDKEMKDESNQPQPSSIKNEEMKEPHPVKTESLNTEAKDQPVDTEMVKIEVPEQKEDQAIEKPEGNAA